MPSPDMAGSLPEEDRMANTMRVRQLLDSAKIRRAAALLRMHCISDASGVERCRTQKHRKAGRVQTQSRCSGAKGSHPALINESVQTIPEFLQESARVDSPIDVESCQLHPLHSAAVRYVSAAVGNLKTIERARGAALRILRKSRRDLEVVENQIRNFMPPHILAMPQQFSIALTHALVLACNLPDKELAVHLAMGFEAVGDIAPSGWYPVDVQPAVEDIESLDHAQWHDRLEASIRSDSARTSSSEGNRAVWSKTLDEVKAGLMHGPFSREEIEASCGPAGFRAMKRFAIDQNGKIRACDNARDSVHNSCTSVFERLECETPDWPARVLKEFQKVANETGIPLPAMIAGTEDWPNAYRAIPCSQPQYTCVALLNPDTNEVAWFTLPGFNFGLKSAVYQESAFRHMSNPVSLLFEGLLMPRHLSALVHSSTGMPKQFRQLLTYF